MHPSLYPIIFRKPPAAAQVMASLDTYSTLWPGNIHDPLPAGWTTMRGSPEIFSVSGATGGFVDDSVGTIGPIAIRNFHGLKGVVTIPFGAGSSGVTNANWPLIVIHSDSTWTNYSYILFRQDTGKIQYIEHNGGTDNLTLNGTNALTTGGALQGIRITCGNTSILIEIDSGSGYVTEISGSMIENLTAGQTYCGIGNAVATGAGNVIFEGGFNTGP